MEPTSLPFEKAEIERSLPHRFEKIAQQFPARTAIKTVESSWNYSTLNAEANRLAHTLLGKYGSGSEPVPFLLGKIETQIAAMLGIQKAGKVYLPLDRSLPRARLSIMLEDVQARVLVTDDLNRSQAEEFAHGNVNIKAKSKAVALLALFDTQAGSFGGVRLFEVPGTHRGMMQEPNVRILAYQLNQCIASLGESRI